MDILKAFSLCDKEYPINIQGTIDEPLFQANQIGKLLEMTNINKLLSSFDNIEKVITKTSTLGGIQNVTFLTERGLYKVLARSNKPIAKKFQNWMVNVIKELRQQGEYRLKQEHEIEKKLIKSQEQNLAKKNTHKILMDFCKMKNVVYICKLCDISEDMFVIKIGSTQNIKERFSNIQTNYKMTPLLLDAFECENHTKFEKWIRNNDLVKPLYYEIKKQNGISTRETFLVNEEQCNDIVKIMHNEVKKFTKDDVNLLIELENKRSENEDKRRITEETIINQTELNIKLEEIRLQRDELRLQHNELQLKIQENAMKIAENHVEVSDNPISPEKSIQEESNPFLHIKSREHTRSPKVYQYNSETLELIQMYDSIINVIREFHSSSPSALKLAAKNNTIYKGFRWLLVDRNMTDVPILSPTVESRTQAIEYIAMIDIQQTKILNVFPSQKEAAIARNLAGFSTISRAIKQQSISSGHYWNLFNRCTEEMRDEYLKLNSLPEQHVKSNGISVLQIHPVTHEEITSYKSITEVLKKFQMSRVSLIKAAETNEIHNGFRWKMK
jgi:prophage antirepressor-like protein